MLNTFITSHIAQALIISISSPPIAIYFQLFTQTDDGGNKSKFAQNNQLTTTLDLNFSIFMEFFNKNLQKS